MKIKSRKLLTILLALILAVPYMPINIMALETSNTTNEVYTEDFSSPDLTGWEKDLGAGRLEVVNEQLEMETDGWVAGSIDYQQYHNTKAPQFKNARLAMDISVKNTHGRFGIVYRHIDAQNYDYIGYDVGGKWIRATVRDGQKSEEALDVNLNVDNQSFRFSMEYVNENIKVYVDDTELYDGPHTDNDAGHFGLRTWGYTDNYAFIQVDNIVYEKMRENEQTEDGHYLVSFKDEDHTGGWGKVAGDGTMEYADQAMNFAADGNTIYSDAYSPNMKNGFVEYEFTPITSARMGFLFRFNGANDFAGFGYDVGGNWNYITGGNWGEAGNKALNIGEKNTVRIEFVNDNYRLTVNNDEVFNGPIDAFTTKSGKAGIRTWGYGSGDTQGQLDLHNMVMGEFSGVNLSPSSAIVRSGDAGLYDININISETTNVLSKITHEGKALEAGTDYVLNEDSTRLTLKKEFIEPLQGETDTKTKVILEYEDGFKAEFPITVLGPSQVSEELYVKDFSDDINGIKKVSGNGEVKHDKGLDITNGQNLIVVDENAPEYKNTEVEFMFDPKNDSGNFAIVLRYNGPDDWLALGQNGVGGNSTSWNLFSSGGQNKQLTQDGNRIYANRMEPYKVKARIVENVATIYLDNAEIYTGEVSGVSNKAGKVGLRYYGGAGANVSYLSVKEAKFPTRVTENIESAEIKSEQLTVNVDKDFPTVNHYTLGGETITGQANKVHEVEINNTMYTPEVTSVVSENEITYSMKVEEIGVSFDVVLTVENNVLDFRIKNINEEGQMIYTINFPEHSLVSMESNKENAALTVNNYREQKNLNLSDVEISDAYQETSIAVLSSDKIAASISNGSIKRRNEVAYQTFVQDGYTSTGIWTNEYLYRGLDNEVIEEPWTKVAITLDRNEDGIVDAIDGAIAYRDDIARKAVGSDVVMQSYNSIAMNVGSNAQYPFLRILDNIKKFNLGTDGFKQNIIIKGYQSEGHDASHPDFNNFSDRAGGLEDFLVLLENAEDNNATVGVHINHTEAYPEAKQYGDDLVSSVPGWSWYDSASQIIRENDILKEEQGMLERLQNLDTSTKGLLEMIYVDVYFDTRWPAHKIADAINDKLGMALGTEYVDEFTKDSVWAHHIGNRFNDAGNLVRVIHNNDKDIFGNQALFRDAHTRNVGFNGWQNSVDYNKSIQGFFTQVLPNKYLAQYPIMNYETTNKAVLGKERNVVTEMVNGANHISQDGKKVAEGNKIFIPWTNEGENEKIYAWSDDGSEKTWDLPNGWEDVAEVELFKLSDQGRELIETIKVNDGKVTIDLDKQTGYTLYKGSENVSEKSSVDVDWTQGSVVKDAGFDSHAFKDWKKDSGSAKFHNNNIGNTHMIIGGAEEGVVSQELTGLEVGESYGASVWTLVENGKRAKIRITDGDNVYENYIDKSDVIYGVKHTDKNRTYFQRMGVKFIAQNDTVLLELIGEESDADGKVDFNDVRVRKLGLSDQKGHTFLEDFENVDEGFGPFVSTQSDNSHLSETNKPHTKDTIDGRYSLKIRYGDHMRTLPQTMRLKANTEYELSIDYIAYQDGIFNASIKTDDGNETLITKPAVKHTDGENPGTINLEFTTGDYDDYYLDISPRNAGQGEYILDNLILDEIVDEDVEEVDKTALEEKVAEAEDLDETAYTEESWDTFAKALASAKTVVFETDATQGDVDEALATLNAAHEGLEEAEEPTEPEDPADKTALEEKITDVEDLDETTYTEESWTTFAEALAAAKAVASEGEATQGDVDEALAALTTAHEGLKEAEEPTESEDPADKTALEEKIAEVEDLDETAYTEESWTTLTEALAVAKIVASETNATQDNVDEALAALTAAHEDLKEAEESTEPGEPGADGKPGENGDSDKDNNLPNTATNMFNWLALGLLIIGMGALLVVVRRKKESNNNL
ncbi:Endo-alpha-N-acetylgalactosaminidase precursor [Paraliobacillus sp. PM-2]|uniref:endo-alpha-N-acetylgalactosaminidase family protein n=1 Tax=Paraliobacillus sp. PM-2 TaxID=1462524 RepID=UPI00061BB5E9|nr:endo-alpha-N-acetylgalactosaminidase family protein [Paraliobacillus sp. PM-2]CQR48488.1 Endo-alpha-N-acetylgalactosaminidase precursor [Paraliobacillus sp. PM-2]